MVYSVGEIFHDEIGKITVIGIVEGYVICRRPRCFPFILKKEVIPKTTRKKK